MRYLIASIILLFSGHAFAGTMRATIDRTTIALEDELTLSINVVGDSLKPVLPQTLTESFDVGGTQQSHSVSIVNGHMSSSTVYSWSLTPRRAGPLQIPPIALKVDGELLTTQPISVNVQTSAPALANTAPVYATAELAPVDPARTTALVGEQLVYSLKLVARVGAQCDALNLPSFANATVLELGKNRQYNTQLGGDEATVIEIRRAIFPTKPGPLEIGEATFNCHVQRSGGRNGSFDSFFNRGARKTIRANATQIVVQALPPPPPNFSGLVGAVSARASVSSNEVRQGESTTLSVVVQGNADMSRAREPALDLGATFKVYADKPKLESDDSGSELQATRTFESAIVPQRVGDFTIAVPPIVYFDPQQRTYASTNVPPIVVHVLADPSAAAEPPAANAPAAPPGNGAPAAPEPENPTRYVATPEDSKDTPLSGEAGGSIFVVAGSVLGVCAVVAGILVALRMRKPSAKAELRAANRQALASLGGLAASTATASDVSRIIRELVGARSGVSGRALSTDEAVRLLETTSNQETAVEARALFDDCDAATYAGTSSKSVEALITRAKAFVDHLSRIAS